MYQLWSGGTKIVNYHFKLHLFNYCNAVLFYNIHEKNKYLKENNHDIKLFYVNNGINTKHISNYRNNYSLERKNMIFYSVGDLLKNHLLNYYYKQFNLQITNLLLLATVLSQIILMFLKF